MIQPSSTPGQPSGTRARRVRRPYRSRARPPSTGRSRAGASGRPSLRRFATPPSARLARCRAGRTYDRGILMDLEHRPRILHFRKAEYQTWGLDGGTITRAVKDNLHVPRSSARSSCVLGAWSRVRFRVLVRRCYGVGVRRARRRAVPRATCGVRRAGAVRSDRCLVPLVRARRGSSGVALCPYLRFAPPFAPPPPFALPRPACAALALCPDWRSPCPCPLIPCPVPPTPTPDP